MLAELVPAKARAVVYLFTAMLTAAYAVAEANVSLHWGWMAGYSAWTAGAALLAAANTPKPDGPA